VTNRVPISRMEDLIIRLNKIFFFFLEFYIFKKVKHKRICVSKNHATHILFIFYFLFHIHIYPGPTETGKRSTIRKH
jgi:hypothetical protein